MKNLKKRIWIVCLALILLVGGLQPALTEAGSLPDCFIPQVTAQYFNGLLQPMLQLLGAPDPETLSRQYMLTRTQVAGSVLIMSNEAGTVALNGFYSGEAAADAVANTVGLTIAPDVDRSEALSVAATLAVTISETDSSVGDFGELLNWMSDSFDGGTTNMRTMNGYMLLYTRNDQGHVFTLVPAAGVSDEPAEDAPTEAPEPQASPEATAEPTEAPTPEPTEAPNLPDSLEGAVVQWEGLYVQPLRYQINAFSSEDITMDLYFRLLNRSDRFIRVQVEDLTVDGSEDVHGTSVGEADPWSDSGEETPPYCLVNANHDDGRQAGLRAIANAQTVKMTIVLKDIDYDELYRKDVTIRLSDLPGERDVPQENIPQAVSTKAPQQETPSSDYRSLSRGDKGDDVKRLQQKLIDLGWLSDTADGEFGPKTAAAVRAFNDASGLSSGETATAETQRQLFSGYAMAYTEPWIPVDLSYLQWDNITGDGAYYRVKVSNTSKSRTIKGIELNYYITDVWGNRMWEYDSRTTTFTMTVKPGKEAYTTWFYMSPSWYNIDRMYIGVSRIVFDDGTIHENSDISYTYFVLH